MTRSLRSASPIEDAPVVAKVACGVAIMVALYALVRTLIDENDQVRVPAGGWFAAERSLLNPSAPAFAFGVLIYVGLFGYAVRLWLPDARAHQRRRRVVVPATASMVLNGGWLLAADRGWVPVMVIALTLTLGVVVLALEAMRRVPAHNLSSLLLLDGAFGIYLGWLLYAFAGNVMVLALWLGLAPGSTQALALAVALLVAVTAASVCAVWRYAGNWGIPAAFIWGLIWTIRARVHEGPPAPLLVALMVIAAMSVAAVFMLNRRRAPQGAWRTAPWG